MGWRGCLFLCFEGDLFVSSGMAGWAGEVQHSAARKVLLGNLDRLTDNKVFEEFDDVCHSHANAAVASGLAEFLLFGSAVNVDEAFVCVLVLTFESLQPENA